MENICKDIWIFQLFESTSSVIGRIIRETILTLPRCLYFIYFHIAFIFCEVNMIKCDIYFISVKLIFFVIFRKELSSFFVRIHF